MKFGQLIEYNRKIVLLENHIQNVVEKLFPDPLLKNQNWAYIWINSLKFLSSWFLLYVKLGAIEIYSNVAEDQKRSRTSLSVSFCAWFLKKNCYILLTDQISLTGCLCFVK